MSVLDQLPWSSDKRMAVRVTPDARRQIAAGHPWIFNESISSISHRGAVGDLAVIFDNDRNFVAIGLWDPGSPIRIRVLHHGKPATIDAAFWQQRVAAAVERRGARRRNSDRRLPDPQRRERRLPWSRPRSLRRHVRAEDLLARVDTSPEATHACHRRAVRARRARAAAGAHDGRSTAVRLERRHGADRRSTDSPVLFHENGLVFEADVVHGQKTGHFLDQRENRALVGSMSAGMRVLDVFAATGGFGIYAAAGGATRVTSVDQSEPTLAAAERNFAHNASLPNVRHCEHDAMIGDAYEVMDRLIQRRKHYDIVVVDPPAFAQRKSNVDRALHAYGQLTQRAVQLVRTDGLLVQASCSSRITEEQFYANVRGSAQRAGYDLVEVRRTGHAIDHPVTFAQGGYLKALFARVIPLEY